MMQVVFELLFVLCVVFMLVFGAVKIVETMGMIAVEIWHFIKDLSKRSNKR